MHVTKVRLQRKSLNIWTTSLIFLRELKLVEVVCRLIGASLSIPLKFCKYIS